MAMNWLYEGDVPQGDNSKTKPTTENEKEMSLMSAEEEGVEGAEGDDNTA